MVVGQSPSLRRSMSKQKADRHEQKVGPENLQFDKFKRKRVRVNSMNGDGGTLEGILEWVDVYTMGVQVDGADEPSIVYKGPGMVITLAD